MGRDLVRHVSRSKDKPQQTPQPHTAIRVSSDRRLRLARARQRHKCDPGLRRLGRFLRANFSAGVQYNLCMRDRAFTSILADPSLEILMVYCAVDCFFSGLFQFGNIQLAVVHWFGTCTP